MRTIAIITALCLALSAARGDDAPTPQELIRRMGDPALSLEEHRKAAGELSKMDGKEIIPALIEGMKDERIFEPDLEVPSQPGYITAPGEPPHKRMTYDMSVGMMCRFILRNLLSVPQSKTDYYPVENWDAWWHGHRDMTLQQMRQEVQAVIKKQMAPNSPGRAQ